MTEKAKKPLYEPRTPEQIAEAERAKKPSQPKREKKDK